MIALSFFLALINMPTKLLITIGYRWNLVAIIGGCLALNAAANYVAIGVLDGGLTAAALATSVCGGKAVEIPRVGKS